MTTTQIQSTDLLLHLADNNLILAQRNSEWCGHGPVLEQDIAITNITLDLIGQARMLYQMAADEINKERGTTNVTEDTLAYHRNEREFKNILLTELPIGDWGFTILRQYLFSEFQFLLYTHFASNAPEPLAGFAVKSLKEIKYHVTWSREWVLRLGDGTEESAQRINKSLNEMWQYTGEMFEAAPYESKELMLQLYNPWLEKVLATFEEANMQNPGDTFMQTGGKSGVHTEHMGYILAEMQYLQRMYPNATW